MHTPPIERAESNAVWVVTGTAAAASAQESENSSKGPLQDDASKKSSQLVHAAPMALWEYGLNSLMRADKGIVH
jgi:hypothetical protein